MIDPSLNIVGTYTLRPYNFFLNPVPDKRLDVERDFTFQSGGRTPYHRLQAQLTLLAVAFLLGVGFRMDAPYSEGVPYLSRGEEGRARATAAHRRNKSGLSDISIKDGDTEAFEFVRKVQHEVRVWTSKDMA